ncbi:MAG: hypothetical protein A3G18_07945 [Rhodospirillales bacterium RIFCSPLOWO2_12_FULL_58_28]|nr:MAG: hypothetical protein A3H92_05905 [Rhodospirillales bacterium RIFCSPLOWO2_02_FULL_58_16]OHC78377.1 MAG: hypothetical protein A3G18_07945 [Rhodospirillales bacterium RIFCSPLOWO2_12_FULL_58_28]
MKVLFLDESGDHNLSVIDPQYPMFVLGGIIVDKDYADGPLTVALNEFKRDIFGRTDIVLHTADITRNRNGFEQLKDEAFRSRFHDRLNAMMRDLCYSVVACAISKDEHLSRYGVAALDPYLLSLDILVERFCSVVGKVSGGGVIVAEKRDTTLDRELELAWLNLKIQGTRYLQASAIEDRILGLNLRAKQDNIAGLQLADLVVSPIGRHLLGKLDKEDWRIVEGKFRRDRRGKVEGYGLVILPK